MGGNEGGEIWLPLVGLKSSNDVICIVTMLTSDRQLYSLFMTYFGSTTH